MILDFASVEAKTQCSVALKKDTKGTVSKEMSVYKKKSFPGAE